MTKFVSYEKLSKKAQRKVNAQKRNSWNGLCPATRVVPNGKVYNRAKVKADDRH